MPRRRPVPAPRPLTTSARVATDSHGRSAVLAVEERPSLAQARRRLGVALACYVMALAVLAALGSISTSGPLRLLRWPEVDWRDWGGPVGLASTVLRALPVGFVLALAWRHRARPLTAGGWWRIAAAGAATVLVAEAARWVWRSPVRPVLVIAGGLAAVAGAAVYGRAFARRRADHAFGSVLDRVLPLELPLTGAVMLLVPPLWLVSQDVDRLPLVALLGCFGASLLASARLSRGPAAGGPWTHAAVAGAWLAGATLPGWVASPTGAAGVVAGGAALAAAHALLPPPDATDRRFEGPALRRALPLLVAFLAAAATWPLAGGLRELLHPAVAWGWGSGGARGAIEHATAFAVVGYAGAELRGRREERTGAVWWAIAPWVVLGALAIEGVRAYHGAHVAGGARLGAAVLAARLGASIYTRHRDHVRAWRAAGGRIRGGVRRVGLRDLESPREGGGRRRG